MLKEIDWPINRTYSSTKEYEPLKFYLDCLTNSNSFDILLGYFSSAAINVLSLGFATFLSSGGTMRAIVNNILSEKDLEAIKQSSDSTIDKNLIDLSNMGLQWNLWVILVVF